MTIIKHPTKRNQSKLHHHLEIQTLTSPRTPVGLKGKLQRKSHIPLQNNSRLALQETKPERNLFKRSSHPKNTRENHHDARAQIPIRPRHSPAAVNKDEMSRCSIYLARQA
uniref:Uncharacterized protein n=1 Tax=Arundo donax TaxID=35708 RepID=A0A0A9GL17_ARUDO